MNLPFTNIRQVLSLHNKVSPEKIFLTVISDEGREELSYAEFSARCHQTANFLQEDLGIEPGDVVAIWDDYPASTAVLLMACWLVGANVFPYGVNWREIHLTNAPLKAQFIRDGYESETTFKYIAQAPYSEDKFLVQLGGEPTEGYAHFDTLVKGMPNSFFNNHPEPTRTTPAFFSNDFDTRQSVFVTQGELLDAAQTLATIQSITGNQRLISYLPLSGVSLSPAYLSPTIAQQIMALFVATLLVGSSLIVGTQFEPSNFWHLIAASRVHIAFISITHIQQLIAFAKEQKALGKPIYGEGIYQQDITQLRHIYCPDAKGKDDLIKQFTAIFPFPVVTNSE